jgi:hypothetical protein
MAKNFSDLVQPILDDPVRAARVAKFADEALQDVIAYQFAELRRGLGDRSRRTRQAARDDPSRGVSKLEHSADPKLSTLRKLIEGLGGTLTIHAEIDGQNHPPLAHSAAGLTLIAFG